ncbi:type III pantothenate kinase [Salinibius halmophilus]|uniref:type III pantothenate kinase n=1 Tax=Salinibius halmophilus TaxID=1853216 RepID=UPI000E662B67|nr:type III pantothenate kinase [Salinibius halmophilus]
MFDQNKTSPVFVDIGNTAIKARYQGNTANYSQEELLKIDFAVVANVRTNRFVTPEHWCEVGVVDCFAGFETCYDRVSDLGVDRWLAMLAIAPRLQQGECCILVDAGTAIKIEVFTRDKQLGGFILPGIQLAQDALFTKADRLNQASFDGTMALGQNTLTTIGRAMPAAVLALIEKLVSQYNPALLALTGGNADVFVPHLPSAQTYDNLVLDGLELWWAKQ